MPSALYMGPVMRRLAAIAIAGIAHTTVSILQLDLFLFKIAHASRPTRRIASIAMPLLRRNTMTIDSNVNRGIYALLVLAMAPLVATRSNRSTVMTTIAAENSGSFHMAIEYVAI